MRRQSEERAPTPPLDGAERHGGFLSGTRDFTSPRGSAPSQSGVAVSAAETAGVLTRSLPVALPSPDGCALRAACGRPCRRIPSAPLSRPSGSLRGFSPVTPLRPKAASPSHSPKLAGLCRRTPKCACPTTPFSTVLLHQLCTRLYPEVLHHGVLVEGNRPGRNVKPTSNLLHREPFGEELEHFALAGSEFFDAGSFCLV